MLGALHGVRSLSRASFRIASSLNVNAQLTPVFRGYRVKTVTPALPTARNFHQSTWRSQQAAPRPDDAPEGPVELTRFQDLADHGLVSPAVINIITQRMHIDTMTDVQRLTINETLDGADVIAQAKTGTGKTLAFLTPIVQRILRDQRLERRSYGSAGCDIRALIVSPTRELAEQIAVEAKKVVSATNVRVQTAVGGTGKREGLRRMQREGCHILVGTPGRLKDILSDPYSGVKLDKIEVFVLDEADRLLDIGFAPEIEHIQEFMPPKEQHPRQTLMFSATVPREVVGLVRKTLRPDFKFIRTTDPNEQPTHERIPQKVVFVRGMENRLPAVFELAQKAIEAQRQDPSNIMPFKAIVYFPTTSDVSLAYEAFSAMRGGGIRSASSTFEHPLGNIQITQMHSKLSQDQRTRNSARFRTARSAILFSSDVTARGMDFPDVSHVIQLGLPRSDDDYIHRLGRTGRAGKSGEGWLIVSERQMRDFRRGIGADLPITPTKELVTASINMTQPGDIPESAAKVLNTVQQGVKSVPFMDKAQAYMSLFGVLRGERWADPQDMVDSINDLARYGWGLEELPRISPEMLAKLNLKGVEGLNVVRRRHTTGQNTFAVDDPFADVPGRNRATKPSSDGAVDDPFANLPGRNRAPRTAYGGARNAGGYMDRSRRGGETSRRMRSSF